MAFLGLMPAQFSLTGRRGLRCLALVVLADCRALPRILSERGRPRPGWITPSTCFLSRWAGLPRRRSCRRAAVAPGRAIFTAARRRSARCLRATAAREMEGPSGAYIVAGFPGRDLPSRHAARRHAVLSAAARALDGSDAAPGGPHPGGTGRRARQGLYPSRRCRRRRQGDPAFRRHARTPYDIDAPAQSRWRGTLGAQHGAGQRAPPTARCIRTASRSTSPSRSATRRR